MSSFTCDPDTAEDHNHQSFQSTNINYLHIVGLFYQHHNITRKGLYT